jgi:hypothetical protein
LYRRVATATVNGAPSPSPRARNTLTRRDPDPELERELRPLCDASARAKVFPVPSLGLLYRW